MPSDWKPTEIDGVQLRRHVAHGDERGWFRELWRESWPDGDVRGGYVQANHSRSAAGVLRGLHFHLRQADLWIVLRGRAYVGVVDLRGMLQGEADRPASLGMELGEGECILIPERVAHGFWALDELDLLYLVTNEYDGSDEHGFAWNDPLGGVGWPGEDPLLSGRDATAPSLSEALRALR